MAETGTTSDASRPRVFISYSREDSAFANRLALILNDRGFEAVIDREDVDAGEAWQARVRPLVLSADQVIVILTAKSGTLDSVRWEADLATGSGKRTFVVVPAPLEHRFVLAPPLSASRSFHFYQHPTRADSGIYAGPALEQALNADLAWRRQYTRLFLLAEKWKDQNGADELLLRGDALAAALNWRTSIPRGEVLILAVADFLDASERAEAHPVEPTDAVESRLVHFEERQAAAEEAARVREIAPAADWENSPSDDALPDGASPGEEASRPKPDRAKGTGLLVPALMVLLLFAGAGAAVWQIVPRYLTAPVADASPLLLANTAGPEAPTILTETSEPAPSPPEASLEPAAPKEPAADPAAAEAAATEPAAAAGLPPEETDWLAARAVGNIAAFRTYVLKWPEGSRHDQALSAARRRIKTLSTKPESVTVLLPGPLVYRELPTFRDKGAKEGAAGQVVNFVDRIASPIEGEWLVLEREGAWPFRFVSVREIESEKP